MSKSLKVFSSLVWERYNPLYLLLFDCVFAVCHSVLQFHSHLLTLTIECWKKLKSGCFHMNTNYRKKHITSLHAAQGKSMDAVSSLSTLYFLLDQELSLQAHIANGICKLRLGFYYRNESCFFLRACKLLLSATFLPLLDYGDFFHVHASTKCLY